MQSIKKTGFDYEAAVLAVAKQYLDDIMEFNGENSISALDILKFVGAGEILIQVLPPSMRESLLTTIAPLESQAVEAIQARLSDG